MRQGMAVVGTHFLPAVAFTLCTSFGVAGERDPKASTGGQRRR